MQMISCFTVLLMAVTITVHSNLISIASATGPRATNAMTCNTGTVKYQVLQLLLALSLSAQTCHYHHIFSSKARKIIYRSALQAVLQLWDITMNENAHKFTPGYRLLRAPIPVRSIAIATDGGPSSISRPGSRWAF